ncbi:MAG: CsbD family protein [Ardenticatenia bacterium]|nr:MAG: CsbD family protein [Ardenticatenia bacterium]
MNRTQLQGRWRQIRGRVRERWGHLTNDDLDVIAGRWDRLVGTVQERYGLTREQAERQVDEFLASLEDAKSPNVWALVGIAVVALLILAFVLSRRDEW